MPYSIAQSNYWDCDPASLGLIEGANDILDWFGFLPSFHDSTIIKIEFENGNGVLEVAAFRMTDKTDERGFFVLDRHAIVTFHLTKVRGMLLDCQANPTVMELGIRRLSADNLPASNAGASENDLELALDDVCGGSGSIYASEVRVSLVSA